MTPDCRRSHSCVCIWQSAKVPDSGSQSPTTVSIIRILRKPPLQSWSPVLLFVLYHHHPCPSHPSPFVPTHDRHALQALRHPGRSLVRCLSTLQTPTLRRRVAHHSPQVRAVVSPRDDLILSASRDATAITWSRSHPTAPFSQATVLRPGPRFVNSLAYIPPSPGAPEGERRLSTSVVWT